MPRARLCALALALLPSTAVAQSCINYPYSNGINIEERNGAVRILSTITTPIQGADDAASKAARAKAEVDAIAALKNFLTSEVTDPKAILKAVESAPSMVGDHYQERVNASDTVNRIAPQAKGLVPDITLFRLCTIKGAEYRVTVAVRPEAMKKAVKGPAQDPTAVPASAQTNTSAGAGAKAP